MQPLARDVDVGIRLRMWDHGGHAPVVLLLHGYLDTGRSHDTIARLLGESARVIALDFRGHGASAHVGAGGSYHLLDHMKDTARVIARLPQVTGRAIDLLVGHSMGGNVALLVAGSAPELVPRLLLLDTLGPPCEDVTEQPERLGSVLRAQDEVKPFRRLASLDDAIARVRASNPGLSEEGARRMTAHVLVTNDDGTLSFPLDDRLRGPAPVRYEEAFYTALCGRVQAPVHIVRAEHGYLPIDDDLFAARLRALGATLETVDGVGHNVHVEAPERVAAAIGTMLARPPRTRGGAA
jgi:pimeloyl-ACP methyl ester carboxylesterase